MTKGERQMLIVLAIAAVVALPFLPIWGGGEGPGAGSAGGNVTEGGGRAGGAGATIPILETALMERSPDETGEPKRNLFAYGSAIHDEEDWEDADIEENADPAEAEMQQPDQKPEREETRTPRLQDYEFIGYIQVGRKRFADFMSQGRHFYGAVGATINSSFTIRAIADDHVVIHVIAGDFNQKLPLRPPAGVDESEVSEEEEADETGKNEAMNINTKLRNNDRDLS